MHAIFPLFTMALLACAEKPTAEEPPTEPSPDTTGGTETPPPKDPWEYRDCADEELLEDADLDIPASGDWAGTYTTCIIGGLETTCEDDDAIAGLEAYVVDLVLGDVAAAASQIGFECDADAEVDCGPMSPEQVEEIVGTDEPWCCYNMRVQVDCEWAGW